MLESCTVLTSPLHVLLDAFSGKAYIWQFVDDVFSRFSEASADEPDKMEIPTRNRPLAERYKRNFPKPRRIARACSNKI